MGGGGGGGANFRYFRDCSNSHEIYTPRKFATVGKGHLVKLLRVCTRLWSKRMASTSNLLSPCDRRTQYETGNFCFCHFGDSYR